MANKKDITLTVTGIIASLVLAYLLWRVQQRDSASSTAVNDAAAQAQAEAQETQSENESSFLANYQSQASQGVGGAVEPSYDSIGDAATTSGADDSDLLSSIINAYSGTNATVATPSVSSMLLNQGLTADLSDATAVSNVPTSLAQISSAGNATSSASDSGTSSTSQGGAVATNPLTAIISPTPVAANAGGSTQ
jgi:hypothetical protein